MYTTDFCTTRRGNYWWDSTSKWNLSVTSAPAAEPVTVDDIKAHSRVDLADEDGWIRDAISAARRLCETFTKRAFVTQTLRLSLDQMPAWEFYLPRPPLVSVTTIKYQDSSNVQQTISGSAYTVDTYSEPGRITPAYNTSWPTGIVHTNAIEVIYVAGYGAASAVPASIKQAIKMTVESWYQERGTQVIDQTVAELPMSAKSLLRAESWGYLP